MKRVRVAFNTLTSAPKGLVKFPADGSMPPSPVWGSAMEAVVNEVK